MNAPRTSLVAWIGLFAACGSGPEVVDTDPGTTEPPVEGRLDPVDPPFGTNRGNEFVTLTGGPFPTDPVVTFGGSEATVLAQTANQLQVSTPATDKTDWVMVKVTGPDGVEIKRKKAYQYWEDGSGQTGLWGEMFRMDYLGSYWTPPGTQAGPYTPPPQAQVRMVFLNPSDIEYQAVWGEFWDYCEVDFVANLQATVFDTEMDQFTFSGSDGESIRLEPSTQDFGYFDHLNLEPLLLSPGTTYSLDTGASNGIWPAFGMDDLVTMPDRPEVLNPLLNDSAPPAAGPDIDLQWVPSTNGDYVVAILTRLDATGQEAERATCLLTDDGQHTVPVDTWAEWVPGTFVMVQLGRIGRKDRTLPHNRASSELVGVYWVYGAITAM